MQNKANERRSLVRLPFMLKFRLRNDKGSKTYQARSCDIDPCGIQIETSAPIVPKMEVELWPEDYSANSSYVHGEVIWVKPLDGGDNQRCGITFNRKIDWSIPWPVLAKTYAAPTGSSVSMISGRLPLSILLLSNLLVGNVRMPWARPARRSSSPTAAARLVYLPKVSTRSNRWKTSRFSSPTPMAPGSVPPSVPRPCWITKITLWAVFRSFAAPMPPCNRP